MKKKKNNTNRIPVGCTNNTERTQPCQFVQCYETFVRLLGVETWVMKAAAMKILEATEMWILRRLLKISWIAKVTNIMELKNEMLSARLEPL